MEDEIEDLVRGSLRQALATAPQDISAALAEFGWQDLVYTDEPLAFTALFEEQGYLAADTNALDIAVATVLGLDGRTPVLWPVNSYSNAQEMGGSGVVVADGVSLRGQLTATDDGPAPDAGVAVRGQANATDNILAPVGGRMRMLAVSSIEERALGGMARGSSWVSRRVWGSPTADFGSWLEVETRARLAIASELVGVMQRIVELAAEQVSSRRQFGRPIAANQAVRFRLAEAHVEVVGAKALIAAAWEDGSPASAGWAKAVAGSAHDAVAKHAMQVCGAVGLSNEHPLPALVRRGIALDALLGPAMQQQPRIGRELIAHQRDMQASRRTLASAVGWF
jgi:hypothetical protein